MIPFSKIKCSDAFRSPYRSDIVWVVEDLAPEEKMILVEAISLKADKKTKAMWVKNTHRIFNESRRTDLGCY